MRCVVISQPKAGTYLCANLLEELGMQNTFMHLSQHDYQRYDFTKMQECRESTSKFTYRKPLTQSLGMIPEDHFAVGHLKYNRKNIDRLSGFKKIVLTRELTAIKESAERWKALSGRNVAPKSLVGLAEEIAPWINENDTFQLRFECMINKEQVVLDKLQRYLFGDVRFNSVEIMERALARDSLTKSDIRK